MADVNTASAASNKALESVTVTKLLSYAQSLARNETPATKADPPEKQALLAVRDALFAGTKRPSRTKKRSRAESEFMNRPCSPTLFGVLHTAASTTLASAAAAISNGPVSKRPNLAEKVENFLATTVSALYDRPTSSPVQEGDRLVAPHRYTSLGYMLLPIRRPSVLDKWTAHEIAVFEAAVCLHGKRFDVIKSLLPAKSTKEVIEFYYTWKNTSHKPVWKKTFKPVDLE